MSRVEQNNMFFEHDARRVRGSERAPRPAETPVHLVVPPERHANAFPDFGEFTQTTTLACSASKPDDWVIVVVSESLTDVLSADPKLNYREMQRCFWVLLALPTKQDSSGQQRLIRRAA